MALHVEHEIHTRRFGRNLGVGLLLGAFVVLMLALTVIKVTRGAMAPHANDGGLGNMTDTTPIAPAAKVTP